MKYQFKRRAGALALALVFALTLSLSLIEPAWAAAEEDGTVTLTITSSPASPKVGDSVTLTATLTGGPEGNTGVTYTWQCTDGASAVTLPDSYTDLTENTLKVTAAAAGTAKFTVTAKWTEDPEQEKQKTSDPFTLKIITADDSSNTGGGETKEPGLIIYGTELWTSNTEDKDKTLTALVEGVDDADLATLEITWTAQAEPGLAGVVAPTFSGGTGAKYFDEDGKIIDDDDDDKWPVSMTDTSKTVNVIEHTAGRFVIEAEFTYKGVTYRSDTFNLTISGIVLSGMDLNARKGTLEMVINSSRTLTATPYGAADDRNATQVEWISNDASVVSVMPNAGSLNAWTEGTTTITATKGKYRAECDVTVKVDESVIATKNDNGEIITASVSAPLTFDTLSNVLEEICKTKTESMTGIEGGLSLRYITNLKVSPDQGTLYLNYSTESNTGNGVGYNDQFKATASGTIRSFRQLYFVPKPGFSGVAEITFSAVAEGNRNFTGTVKVNVNVDSGGSGGSDSEGYQISYRARAGEPVWFSTSDFSTYCQSMGRDYSYIIFNLPKASEGVLYYNYVAGSGNPVTTSTRFTQSGRYTVDDVCFVPNVAYNGGAVLISFRAVDTAGGIIDGTLTVNVVAISGDNDPSTVTVTAERGQPAVLQGELFNAACLATINDTLSFVTFKLPDPDLGALYINYQSEDVYEGRVTSGTRCYYSGVPSLSSVSFVPTPSASGRIAIPYTGYGVGGASFGGTLYVSVGEADRSIIYYSVARGGSVTFSASDFNEAGQYVVGSNATYVKFTGMSSSAGASLGTLNYYIRNTNTTSTLTPSKNSPTNFYVSATTTTQNRLNRVYFTAGNTVGAVTITYTAYSSSNKEMFTGKVVIQIGADSPEDIPLSCNTGGYARLTASTVSYVCSEVMSGNLSHIEITSVPDAKVGHLYFNYNGFRTGSLVKQGDQFYRLGSPGINQLTFVPSARFVGKAEITYIGYSETGQQVSGRIVINVTEAQTSLYFNDMGYHVWAIDSVDYLRRNGVVEGIGDNLYNPSGTVVRGDFTLMLIRAYGFTANGSHPFRDVPAESYYADAIRIAYLKGVISGDNGYFYPQAALTRQDAMVMIYNAMKASGKTVNNGLALDFSVYHDADQIAPYAIEAMGSLILMGVVEGDGNGYLRPRSQLNRAEAAMLLHAIMTL